MGKGQKAQPFRLTSLGGNGDHGVVIVGDIDEEIGFMVIFSWKVLVTSPKK